MSLPALQILERKFERHKRIFELQESALEKKIERHIQLFEQRRAASSSRKIEHQLKKFEQSFESMTTCGLSVLGSRSRFAGAVTPSGRVLARTMAGYVDPGNPGPVDGVGSRNGSVTEALSRPRRSIPCALVLVEFDPTSARILRARFRRHLVQGDAYGLRRLLAALLLEPAAAFVSGLPLFTKPLKTRLRLLFEAFGLMLPGAPFIQFTYNAVPPLPARLDRVRAQASERVWMNIPPARVWVYRRD